MQALLILVITVAVIIYHYDHSHFQYTSSSYAYMTHFDNAVRVGCPPIVHRRDSMRLCTIQRLRGRRTGCPFEPVSRKGSVACCIPSISMNMCSRRSPQGPSQQTEVRWTHRRLHLNVTSIHFISLMSLAVGVSFVLSCKLECAVVRRVSGSGSTGGLRKISSSCFIRHRCCMLQRLDCVNAHVSSMHSCSLSSSSIIKCA